MPSDTQRIVSTDTRPYARLKSRDSIFCQGENRDASTRSKGEIVVEVNQVGSSYERHSLPSTQTEVVTTGRISTRNTTIHPAEGVNGRDSHEIEAGGRNRTPAARGSKSKSWKPITAKPPHTKIIGFELAESKTTWTEEQMDAIQARINGGEILHQQQGS